MGAATGEGGEVAPTPAAPPHPGGGPPGTCAPACEPLRQRVIAALHTVHDPELPADLVELGLVYRLDVEAGGQVAIAMTLTAPGCPVAQTFPGEVEQTVRQVAGVTEAKVTLVWDPPWGPDRMSQVARLQVGML
ncbi:MAG: FeS assembly SUF system protein [Nitrospirae bacterium CG18_big_fil_WC_8_21_14_2_50_70_55]|nr:MAG: FeS assembly SUF system protein [Nitrospirae bacterium CG18_big_fil_WC_8_21_14_2_50_70_55]